MDDLARAPSLDEAWRAFVDGERDACATLLTRRMDALAPALCGPAVRLATAWTAEAGSLVDDGFLVGQLARKAGHLEVATRAQHAVLLAVWPHVEEAQLARWFQVGASCELALNELHRNRGTTGLQRLRALRQQLIDQELRDLLAEEPDVEQPAIELLDHQLEYLEAVLRLTERDAVRPSYVTDDEPPRDPEAPPADPVPPGRERGAWPSPLERVVAEPLARPGFAQLSELNDATWRHLYDGREAAKEERHEAALEAFDRAIQCAERVSTAFRGSWDARRVLAWAIAGRSGALEELALADRALEDAALASGLLADATSDYPQVVELLTSEAWCVARESWRRCQLHRPDDEVIERCDAAIALLERARVTPVGEPDDLLSLLWVMGHAARHCRLAHRFGELPARMLRSQRVSHELVSNYYDQALRHSADLLEDAPGPIAAVTRWLIAAGTALRDRQRRNAGPA